MSLYLQLKDLMSHRIAKIHCYKVDPEIIQLYESHYFPAKMIDINLQRYRECPWQRFSRKIWLLKELVETIEWYKHSSVRSGELNWVIEELYETLRFPIWAHHTAKHFEIYTKEFYPHRFIEQLEFRAKIQEIMKPIHSKCLGYWLYDVEDEADMIRRIEQSTKLIRVLSCLVLEYVIV